MLTKMVHLHSVPATAETWSLCPVSLRKSIHIGFSANVNHCQPRWILLETHLSV